MRISFGFHIRDYGVLFRTSFGLTFKQEIPASMTTGVSFGFYAYPSANYGYALLPKLSAFGGEVPAGYGHGNVALPPLYSEGEGGMYVPPEPEYGSAWLPKPYSIGYLQTSSPGSGDASLPSLISKGGEGNYGEASVVLPPLYSYGYYGGRADTAYFMEMLYAIDGLWPIPDYVLFFDVSGQLTDTMSGTREQVARLIEELQLSDSYSVLGSFVVDFNETLQMGDNALGQRTDGETHEPVFADGSRVWVVNIDTGASSQYDGYGFNSFFEDNGKYYGVAEDGIYLLEGDDDAGRPLSGMIDLGNTNYGSPGKKKSMGAYIGVASDGTIYLQITVDGTTRTYQMNNTSTAMKTQRIPVSHRQFGTYWNPVLISESDFEIADLNLTMYPITRRVR